MTQRPAILSYWTIGSPSALVPHGALIPFHKFASGIGPSRRAPLDLLKTAKYVLTAWTYWVAPTAPFASGAGYGVPDGASIPSKFRATVAATCSATAGCVAGLG